MVKKSLCKIKNASPGNFPWLASPSILARSAGDSPAVCIIEKSRGVYKKFATGHEHPWLIFIQRASCKISEEHKNIFYHAHKF
ncbi:hypothetical protein [Longilinea arvoryzae]|uniref:hypothetical protein n=1 Tax=Longilinea arvoryzae TaxID=360412 RepID=UPI0009462EF8|nr:hypothetical protein [Longilinea arvoryzae]